MTVLIDLLPCAGLTALCCFCVWMAERRDRSAEAKQIDRTAQRVVAYAEDLCRAAAGMHPTRPEETDQP